LLAGGAGGVTALLLKWIIDAKFMKKQGSDSSKMNSAYDYST
jgi:hypothetical protein